MNYYNNNNNIVVIIDANRGTMMNLRTALFPPRLTPTVRVVLYTFFFFFIRTVHRATGCPTGPCAPCAYNEMRLLQRCTALLLFAIVIPVTMRAHKSIYNGDDKCPLPPGPIVSGPDRTCNGKGGWMRGQRPL